MDSVRKNTAAAYVSGFLARYPCSEIQDIYKRLYQAFHGPEHAITDREKAWEWLMSEWESMDVASECGSDPIEAIYIDIVTPHLYAIHLVPAKAIGLNPERIFGEFLKTAESFPKCDPSGRSYHELLIEAWNELGASISSAIIKMNPEEYSRFTESMKKSCWPAVHHSEKFQKAHNPHYRLVADASLVL